MYLLLSLQIMELFSLQTLIFLSLLSLYIYLSFLRQNPKLDPTTGLKIYPLVGTLPEFIKNRHRFLDWSTEVLRRCPSNTALFRHPGKVHAILTANPANVEHMLKTNFQIYPKGTHFISLLEDFLGQGIFNSDGNLWKVQRKTASYEFNTKSLRNFVMETARTEIQTRLIPILQRATESNQVLDLQDVLERFAFDNICKVAFNVDPGCLDGDGTAGAEFMEAFEAATTLSSDRFMYTLDFSHRIKKYLNVGSEKKLVKSIATVHEFADNIVKSRMEEREGRRIDEDLLSRFIGTDEISADLLRDIVISFILAGRDTTSSALSSFFWLLSSNPQATGKILRELEKIRANKIGDVYSFDELREMHYLHAAISEAMRLYPPVAMDTKACLEEDVMPDGTFVGKDWSVTYHAYAMGRMESIWGSDCCEFRPDRWIEDRTGLFKPESPFRFPVFHAGPRMCLGKEMAYIQMKSIAASVLESFEIDVQDKEKCPERVVALTLRMKGGLPVKVRERCVWP